MNKVYLEVYNKEEFKKELIQEFRKEMKNY
jgi:hypothetical protein